MTMNNYKNNSPPVASPAPAEAPAGDKNAYETTLKNARMRQLVNPQGKDIGGWDSYRRWLNRVESPDKRRATMDPGLYTWKGYRSWSEKVRRDWKNED